MPSENNLDIGLIDRLQRLQEMRAMQTDVGVMLGMLQRLDDRVGECVNEIRTTYPQQRPVIK